MKLLCLGSCSAWTSQEPLIFHSIHIYISLNYNTTTFSLTLSLKTKIKIPKPENAPPGKKKWKEKMREMVEKTLIFTNCKMLY